MPPHTAHDTGADRRAFLQQFTLGGLALAATPTLLPATTIADLPRLTERGPDAAAAAIDLTWTKKLTGKHKAVYDSPDISGGLAVFRAAVVKRQYREAFGLPTSAITNVIVLRHDGIMLAMRQEFWDRYEIGTRYGVKHPWTLEPITKNPALLTPAEGLPALLAGADLASQLASGVIVLGCALAFADVVDIIAKGDRVSEAAAQTKAESLLMPGIVMQPSGVFATTLAQERGCVYVRAS